MPLPTTHDYQRTGEHRINLVTRRICDLWHKLGAQPQIKSVTRRYKMQLNELIEHYSHGRSGWATLLINTWNGFVAIPRLKAERHHIGSENHMPESQG